MLKKHLQKGFTIVELLIVIVVIGILAALVLNTFAGIQARARDTERQTDVNSIATQLEVYYNDQGYYPLLTELEDNTWVGNNLPGMDLEALKTPRATTDNSVDATAPTASNDVYQYVPATCNTEGCANFVLSWYKEDGGTVETKNSLN